MEDRVKRKDIPPRRRAQILAAARELFSQGGYHGVTVDAIAQRAGISKGNLYWYFASKQDIFKLLMDDVVVKTFAPAMAAMEGAADPGEKLRALAKGCLDAAEAYPEDIHLLWQMATLPETRDLASPEYRRWIEPLVHYLAPLFEAIGDDDPEDTAMLYAFLLDCLTLFVLFDPGFYDRDNLLQAIERKFLGIRREAHDQV